MRAFVSALGRYGLAAALVAPMTVIFHELGHWLAGLALGYDVKLKAASVAGGAKLGEAPGWMVASQAMAGPLVTILLFTLAVAYIARCGPRPWAIALAATAPLRFLVGVSYLAWSAYAWSQGGVLRGSPNFDEYNAAAALAVPLMPILAAELILMLVGWYWLLSRIAAGQRGGAIIGIAGGAAIGLVTWMTLLGPKLLSG